MENKTLDLGTLRSFSPLDGLKTENLNALARKATMRSLTLDKTLFKQGDKDKNAFYLVSGVIELVQDGKNIAIIRAGSPEARNPISPILPRRCTAVVASDRAELLTVDCDLLDVMLTWDQTGTYEVGELGRLAQIDDMADDWMTLMLQTKAFHKVPPANIQAIFMRLQRVDFKAGQSVIKQGEEGDYFYVIVKGKCQVTRETPLNKDGIKLAELVKGDTFGEEALISEARRNANVTMLTDSSLMRLGKDDFRMLLNEPMQEYVDQYEAEKLIAQGAKWLDVRLPSEFESQHLDNALNIPLYFLRIKLKTLDRNTPYVVYCDNGRRSSAAAFILSERDFHTYVLKGGTQAMINLVK